MSDKDMSATRKFINDGQIYQGTVIWFSGKSGIGFIQWEAEGAKQLDMFVHFSDILSEGYKTLVKDQKVTFTVGANKNGDAKATMVKILS